MTDAHAPVTETDALVAARAPSRVAPHSVDEVTDALNGAADEGVQVMPIGTGVDQRPVPRPEGLRTLDTSALGGIESYEPADLTFTAGAGVTLAEIDDALGQHDQWLPFDPARAPERTLGGIVATGATGGLWAGYGSPRDHILGATVVTGDGTPLRLGGRVMKNVAGFDLLRLIIGSRGSLAVVTSATVRVFPRPAVDRLFVLEGSEDEMMALAQRLGSAPLLPAAATVVSDAQGGARLLLRVHGPEAGVKADAAAFAHHLGRSLSAVEPADASALVERARDNTPGAGGGISLRAAALPGRFAELGQTLRDALPGATFAADPLSGRVRAAAGSMDASELGTLRQAVETMGGTLILTGAPAGVASEVGIYGRPRDDLGLALALRDRFDRRGVLWDQALYG